ncbi:Phosphatidylinositol-4-phosphate 5-kinase-like protein 1 [Heterocephalus glaber]|uniref:Phosphatidylinositol 4-phosphate 5-kinase-like protein 1 n=1 Tax=Heterocephalus glaber TaxID=10181 RepID=G5BLF8_HETGA|nr:Phosphatidylinositol-4-phosphate 5-kinase-like protein 1 [Heterocephalus glaber]
MAAPSPGPHEALAPSPEAGQRAPVSSSSRRGLLRRLWDKQTRLGLFEIGPRHELHGWTSMMQAGLWAATQVSIDHPPTGLPTQEDFSEVLTQVHEGFELGTLAGPAFARLRRSLGLAEEDYQAALGPGGPYLQFLSTSKSKASFFLSHDQRFFLKTQRRREVRVLLAHLPRYVQHLQRHPHSLLARLLGVHSLRVAQGKKKYFIIMQSVFYPAGRISERRVGQEQAQAPTSPDTHWAGATQSSGEGKRHCQAPGAPKAVAPTSRISALSHSSCAWVLSGRLLSWYDIKGCQVSRWVEPAPEGSPLVLVLKDLNFQGKTMNLGPQRTWLLRQMELDTAFLRELRVLDYSLLMAFQHLHDDEWGPGSSVIFRIARSVQGPQIPEEPGTQNRRLLPDGPNALHVLDGPEHRYFLGLVDLATVYGLRKRLEHLWKTLRYPGRTFSTVSPARYAQRLCQWVEAHTE